jgi:DNA invertase Pin-like site-specific DNA recombinase
MNSRFMIIPTAVLPPGSVVIAYVRDNGAHNPKNSREEQQRIIMDYCRKHGLVLSKVYSETASGLNGKRNRFLEMLNDITGCARASCPRGLLVLNYARLSRNMDELNLFLNRLMDGGIRVYSLDEKIDPPQ